MFQKEGVFMKPTILNSIFSSEDYPRMIENPIHDFEFDESVLIAVDHSDGQRQTIKDFKGKKVSVSVEPGAISGRAMNHDIFDLCLSWKTGEYMSHENGVLLPYGETFLREEDIKIWDKTKTMSIVASDKTQTPGHKLRHEIINHDGKLYNNFIDVYGRCGKGFGGIENKIDGLKDYQFSIAIENVDEQNWFTEKILDCFLTGTIPVYYGCPNLGQFGFDTEGVVRIESKVGFDQIKDDINSDLYKKAADSGAIEHNFKKAHEYMDLGSRVIDEVNKFIKKK